MSKSPFLYGLGLIFLAGLAFVIYTDRTTTKVTTVAKTPPVAAKK